MKEARLIFWSILAGLMSGCSLYEDDLQRIANQADRNSWQALREGRRGSAAASAASRVIQTYYYSRKYPGSPEQILKAMERGRRSTISANRRSGLTLSERGASTQAGSQQRKPRFVAVSVGRNPETKDEQIMLYDPVQDRVFGNTIYEMPEKPTAGKLIRIDDLEAVGAEPLL